MRPSLIRTLALGAAWALMATSPAHAAFRGSIPVLSGIQHVQGNAEDAKGKAKGEKAQQGQKAAKGKDKSKSSERSNASGEVRGQERAQDVQGMQDSGKGAQQRSQRPSK